MTTTTIKLEVSVQAPRKRMGETNWSARCPRTGSEAYGETRADAIARLTAATRDMLRDPKLIHGKTTGRWYMLRCVAFQYWQIQILGGGSYCFPAATWVDACERQASYVADCESASLGQVA